MAYTHLRDRTTLTFRGTVKLHGTHADVFHDSRVQSRTRVLSLASDNDGCARFFSERTGALSRVFDLLAERVGTRELMIAGEFCGRGIQSKVAVCKLPRMFVAFGVWRIDTDAWLDFEQVHGAIDDRENGIFNVCMSRRFEVVVDLGDPGPAMKVVDELTRDVDAECPFAAALGVKGAGEGIVWTCEESPTSSRLWFKSKGRTHVTPIARPEGGSTNVMQDLLAPMMTVERMRQGVEHVRDLCRKNIGAFSEWVVDDVMKEEADVFEAHEVDARDVRKAVKAAACAWFKETLFRTGPPA